MSNMNSHRLPISFRLCLLIFVATLGLFFILTNAPDSLSPPKVGETFLQSLSPSIDIRFDQPSTLSEWHEHVFNKKSHYKIEPDEAGDIALHASSRDAFSAIFKVINIPVRSKPILSWEWRGVKFPAGEKKKSLGAPHEN